MSAALWAIPPAVIVLGAVVLVLLARQAGVLAAQVRYELDRLSEVHLAVVRVRSTSGELREAADRLDRR